MITKNAIIDSVQLGPEDHGILTAYITLDYGGSIQSFGGYSMYHEPSWKTGGNYCGHFIKRVLDVVDVQEWSKLKGKPVRALFKDDSWNSPVIGLQNIIKDNKFIPSEDFKDLK